MRETAALQYGIPSQKECEPLLEASGKKGKGPTSSVDPKIRVNEAFGTEFNRWISKAPVQVSVDYVAWDIKFEHGHRRTQDNGLLDKYVHSVAHGDPMQRIQVILKDMAGMTA